MNDLISGFVAGMTQTIIGHPFDTVKVRLQTSPSTLRNTMISIFRNEGLRGFYKGYGPPLLINSVINSLIFGLNGYFYDTYQNHFVSGYISGSILSPIISVPQLIKCQIQKETRFIKKESDVIREMYKGKLNPLTGWGATYYREAIAFSVYFGSYNYLQDKYNNPFLNGGIAGIINWTCTYPIDVIKTRKQTYPELRYRDIIKKITLKDNVRGLNITIMRSFIVNASIFYVFETMKALQT